MAVSHGMNLEEVRGLGTRLQNESENLRSLINMLNNAVQSTTWVGPDANEFKGPWWEGHRSQLMKIADDLHGFGQSALNNAQEQFDVSNR